MVLGSNNTLTLAGSLIISVKDCILGLKTVFQAQLLNTYTNEKQKEASQISGGSTHCLKPGNKITQETQVIESLSANPIITAILLFPDIQSLFDSHKNPRRIEMSLRK